MKYYSGIVCFTLEHPYPSEIEGERMTIVGYYRNVVIAAENEWSMKDLLETAEKSADLKSEIDWDGSEIAEISHEELSEKSKLAAEIGEGILYKTGRIFFPDR
jgi:hypothetical protein